MQTGLGFDWTYNKKNNFNGNFRYEQFSNRASGQNEQEFYDYSPPGNQVNNNSKRAVTSNAFATHAISGSLNYKRTYVREGQELEVSLNTSKNNTTIHAGSEQFLHPTDSLIYGTKNSNQGKETGTEIQADYTQPIKNDVKMGFGGKMVLQHILGLTDVHSLDPLAGEYYYNSTLSNEFDYKQHIYALYSEIQFPLKSIVDVKIGGRYERTEINAQYSNATQKINMPGYNTFVPSVYLSRKLTEKQLLKLSYVKRINRPETQDLNPYINTTDPKNISAGNPYLTPEIGHRIELAYNLQFENTGSLMISWFYRSSHNDIQPFNIFYPVLEIGDTTYYNVNYSSSQNIGLEQNTGFNIFTDLRIRNKLSIRPNLFFFYRKITNTIDAGYNSQSLNYRMNVNVNYEFTKTLVGEFFGNFNSPRNEAQGKYPSYTSYSFAFRKQFWNKKGSIAFLANNPFGKYLSQKTEIFGPNFNTYINRQIPIRSFGINFSWKFGKLEFLKDKNSQENAGNAGEDSVK
jgi:outer membrane receptor protein involved in Fe transport